jgi:Mor family transcriptional regulator
MASACTSRAGMTAEGLGEETQTRANITARNREIHARHARGMGVRELAEEFYLSPKTIAKILRARSTGR